jgi:hypothetical protein
MHWGQQGGRCCCPPILPPTLPGGGLTIIGDALDVGRPSGGEPRLLENLYKEVHIVQHMGNYKDIYKPLSTTMEINKSTNCLAEY